MLRSFLSVPPSPFSPGAFSLSDEEGPSEESHSPEGLHQASSLPMLVKEASGAGDGVWGSPGGPWDLSMGPHPHSWSSKQKRGSWVGWDTHDQPRFFTGSRRPEGGPAA